MTNLTDTQIDEIVKSAENSAAEFVENGAIDMREIKDSVSVNVNADLIPAEAIIGDSGLVEASTGKDSADYDELDDIDKIFASYDPLTDDDANLFNIENGYDLTKDERVIDNAVNSAKESFSLDDEAALQLMTVLANMRKDKNYPVFKNLPKELQDTVRRLAMESGMDPRNLNEVSRMLMNEFLNQAGVDQSLIDLEKALNEALKIPSVMDMYSEHIRYIMEEKIPEVVEEIKDTDPDKADLLNEVKKNFRYSYDFSFARSCYLADSKLRKAIRRNGVEFKRSVDLFNYQNEKSNFKMNDATHVPVVLTELFISGPYRDAGVYLEAGEPVPEDIQKWIDMNITVTDIEKFCILIFRSCRSFDPTEVTGASYMYYLVRNIIALRHTNEAKTDFAAELINNICNTITFIRDKESEFNASNMDKPKSAKKHRTTKRVQCRAN